MKTERRSRAAPTGLLGDFHGAILRLAEVLGLAKSATSEYEKSLTGCAEKMPPHADEGVVAAIIKNLLHATGQVTRRHDELGVHLDEASKHVSELGQYLENIRKEALTDGLTGLANRRAFDRRIADCMEDAEARNAPLVLLMLDVDHFKTINDTYGHTVGDQVLRLVATVLLNNIKGQDMAARYGGEEFAVLLPNTPRAGARNVAEMLRRAVEVKELVDRGNGRGLGRVTLSLGVAEFKPGESAVSFIERADAALYQAKNAGRNRVCIGD